MTFEWPVDTSGLPALPEQNAPEYPVALAQRNAAESLAVSVLWALSGRQFGLLTVTVRPCSFRTDWRRRGDYGEQVTSYLLSWEGDRWMNVPCGCSGGCRETGPNMIHLPGPVSEVVSVQIAGAELPDNVWTVEGNVLYRREAPWPPQDMGQPLGVPYTWAVTYKRGLPVPEGVAALTGMLAAEFLAAIANKGNCRLPRTVTTASRQGVTYRVYDPATIYGNGKTGLAEVDMWLATVNPNHILAAPSVR